MLLLPAAQGYESAATWKLVPWGWLILLGGLLEVVGILLVALDLQKTGNEVRKFQSGERSLFNSTWWWAWGRGQTVKELWRRLEEDALKRERAIAELLLDVTAKGKRLRIASVVLLLLGVGAATSGGILSAG